MFASLLQAVVSEVPGGWVSLGIGGALGSAMLYFSRLDRKEFAVLTKRAFDVIQSNTVVMTELVGLIKQSLALQQKQMDLDIERDLWIKDGCGNPECGRFHTSKANRNPKGQ